MTYPVHYVPAGDVLPIFFSTFDGGTGASITMSGLAATDIEIYKDGSTTQRASDAGFTLLDTDGIDFDGTTGIHGFSIDTGDNTDASFYTVGSWFHVVVSSVTVDGQTVNFIAAAFRIMAAEDAAGVPDVNVTHFGGSAGTFASGVPAVNTTLIEGSDATNQIRDSVVDDATRIDASALNTATGTTIPAILDDTDLIDDGTSGLAKIATDVAAILVDTNELQTDWVNGGRLDLLIDGIKTKTDSLTYTVANKVDANVLGIYGDTTSPLTLLQLMTGTVLGTVSDLSATTTSFVTSLTEATNDHYNGRLLTFTDGALAGQQTAITDYNGTTKAVTVDALTEAPGDGDSFVIA